MIKKPFSVFVFLAICIGLVGCSTPIPDPLATGWNFCRSQDFHNINSAIQVDYHNYIKELPEHARYFVQENGIYFFENSSGQHAVKIEIPLDGAYYEHVLIYDKDNKRIKVVVYSGGRYAS
jgi:hypothetical protein